jgi:hypothetical protein
MPHRSPFIGDALLWSLASLGHRPHDQGAEVMSVPTPIQIGECARRCWPVRQPATLRAHELAPIKSGIRAMRDQPPGRLFRRHRVIGAPVRAVRFSASESSSCPVRSAAGQRVPATYQCGTAQCGTAVAITGGGKGAAIDASAGGNRSVGAGSRSIGTDGEGIGHLRIRLQGKEFV